MAGASVPSTVAPARRAGGNPLTGFALAAAAWLLVLGVNRAWFSAAVVTLVFAHAVLRGRARTVIPGSLMVAVPVAASAAIIHIPFGEHRVAPGFTLDGAAVAGVLGLRVLALVAVVIAAAVAADVPRLAVAMQQAGLGGKPAYLVAGALQTVPEARDAARTVGEANRLAGRRVGARTVLPWTVVPLVSLLMTRAVGRSGALEAAGVGLSGRRTTFRPIDDVPGERVLRLLAVPCAALVVAAVWAVRAGWLL